MPIVVRDLGLADYDETYTLQRNLVKERSGERDYLLLVEHPDVYTFGRKSKVGVTVAGRYIERGGEATYHNPGQLVAYPILTLQEGERDLHRYLRSLETVLINVLAEWNILGERREGATGVWVANGARKVASIGIAASNWVTYHGIALNVRNDLSGFGRINPCGFSSDVMTSMWGELGEKCPIMDQVKDSFVRHFSVEFKRPLMV